MAAAGSGAGAGASGLEARGLTRRYAGRTVLHDLGLNVRPGEVVGLLGPNGAGKTTAFRLIAGLEAAHGGRVTLDGEPLDGLPLWQRARRGLGYLPQGDSLIAGLSAAENLALPLEARGVPHAEAIARANERLTRHGLSALAQASAATLSGGERRRITLLRCLLAEPTVVLLDEPFAGVDPVAITALQGTVADLARAGLGVLITDHVVHATLPICDRAVVLDRGVVMAEGTPTEVAADDRVLERYLGVGFRLP